MNGRRETVRRARRSLFATVTAVLLGILLVVGVPLVPAGPLGGSGEAAAALRAAWAKVVGYDAQTSVLAVSSDGVAHRDLVHTEKTIHAPVVDPHGFPPGPCKRLALVWNDGLASVQGLDVRPLFEGFAAHGCAIGYVTSGAENPDGSYDLLSIAPAKH